MSHLLDQFFVKVKSCWNPDI